MHNDGGHTCSSLENNYNHSTTISLIDMARGHVAGNSTLSSPLLIHVYRVDVSIHFANNNKANKILRRAAERR